MTSPENRPHKAPLAPTSETPQKASLGHILGLTLPILGLAGQYGVLGFPPLLPTYGFAVAFGVLIMVSTGIFLRFPAYAALHGVSVFLLSWVILSALHRPLLSFAISPGWQVVLLGLICLSYWGATLFLIGYPLRKGILAFDPACQRLYHLYNRGLVYSGVLLLLLTIELGTSYAGTYNPLQLLLLWQAATWGLLLLLATRVPDEAMKAAIAKQGWKPRVIARPLLLGWSGMLALGTLCELARGEWGLWIGTAGVLSLTFANLWKVWKHLLGKPETP